MIIVRKYKFFSQGGGGVEQREFGKGDAELAARQGITVQEFRRQRAGMAGTGTVHDTINLKVSGLHPNDTISDSLKGTMDTNAQKRGYTSRQSHQVQQEALDVFKESKKTNSQGKLLKNVTKGGTRDGMESWMDQVQKDIQSATEVKQGTRSLQAQAYANSKVPTTAAPLSTPTPPVASPIPASVSTPSPSPTPSTTPKPSGGGGTTAQDNG